MTRKPTPTAWHSLRNSFWSAVQKKKEQLVIRFEVNSASANANCYDQPGISGRNAPSSGTKSDSHRMKKVASREALIGMERQTLGAAAHKLDAIAGKLSGHLDEILDGVGHDCGFLEYVAEV